MYMTSRAWSVWSKIKLWMSLIVLVRGFCHFPWMNLIQLLICSVYEYRSLQSNDISKLLGKHVILFPQYSSNWHYGSQTVICVNQVTGVSAWKSNGQIYFEVCHENDKSNWDWNSKHFYFKNFNNQCIFF